MVRDRLDYLHENPVDAGIVYAPEEYVYSSGIDYYTNRKGKIEIFAAAGVPSIHSQASSNKP